MRVPVLLALVATALASAQDSAPASRFHGRLLSRAEMESDLDVLEAAIREKWAYLEDKEKNAGVDVKALVDRAKTLCRDPLPRAHFYNVVLELVAGLKDGHAAVFTLGVPQPVWRWPFRLGDAQEGVVVVESRIPDLHVGDLILALGWVKTEDAIAKAEKRTIASSDAARRLFAIRNVLNAYQPSPSVGLFRSKPGEKGMGSDPVVRVPCDPEATESGPAVRQPAWSVDRPAAGIARLRVRSFAVEDWSGWLAARPESRDAILAETRAKIDACFREIAGSKALILDVRGNEGGTDLLGIHLAKHILTKRFVYFQLSAKVDGAWTKPYGYEHDPLPIGERFDGPLAILIDEWCFSTTDNFLRAIVEQRPGIVAVVGRPTHGGTGCPATIATLPNSGEQVTLCTQRVYGPKGGLIEGRGTKPTIPVRWTAADYLEGRDPDLAAALEALWRAESRPR